MIRSCLIAGFLLLAGCAALPLRYAAPDSPVSSDVQTVFRGISDKRVIFVGEIHGDPDIHLLQLEIIKYLHGSGKKVVIAMEAFPAGKQEIFDQWIAGGLSDYDFQRLYSQTWNVPFDFYEGILRYAQEQKIPLLAINADNVMIAGVSKNGLGTVPEHFVKLLKFSDCSADPLYAEIVSRTYHASEFPFLCDGQRLRDSVMAYNIAKAATSGNDTIVVLVGAVHAIRPAVPHLLKSHVDVSSVILLPAKVEKIIRRVPDRNITDYLWYE